MPSLKPSSEGGLLKRGSGGARPKRTGTNGEGCWRSELTDDAADDGHLIVRAEALEWEGTRLGCVGTVDGCWLSSVASDDGRRVGSVPAVGADDCSLPEVSP